MDLSRFKLHRLISDDDGHWYCVPLDKVDSFQEWVEGIWYTDEWSKYRVDGPHAFTFYAVEQV